jgi:hypothetical protein
LTWLAGTISASLLLAPVAAAVPAQAADPGHGTLTLKIVDAAGRPVVAQPMLVSTTGSGAPLGGPVASSTYTGDLPVGKYGVAVIGGWGGFTCAGIANCSIAGFTSSDGPRVSTPVITVTDGGTTTYTVRTPLPRLAGAGKVGGRLNVALPSGLTAMASYVDSVAGDDAPPGLSTEPGVVWLRDGKAIAGKRGEYYVPSGADAGHRISARVTYPSLLAAFFSSIGSTDAMVPGPVTTGAVKVTKVTPRLRLRVPGKVHRGTRPEVWLNVSAGGVDVSGVAQVRVGKGHAVRAKVRHGFARFHLPKLGVGT